MKDVDIIPADERCEFCKRKRATKLCDFPIGIWASPHMVIKHGRVITCDNKMCDDCATNIGPEMDFCPKCAADVKKIIKSKEAMHER